MLFEWDWVAVSKYLTPRLLSVLLANSNESYDTFLLVRPEVVCRMFQNMQGVTDVRWLVQEGFIPDHTHKTNVLTNDKYGYVSKSGQWAECEIVSVKVMRYYWDSMMRNLNTFCKKTICASVCQFIASLPGAHTTCPHCKWTMPVSEMWNESVCTYCREINRYPDAILTRTKGGIPTIMLKSRDEDSKMIRQFYDFQI